MHMSELPGLVEKVSRLLEDQSSDLSSGLANVMHAVVLAEDHRYFQHRGVDYRAMVRACWMTVFRQRVQGASTIEQQLVRTLRRRYELKLSRKVTEVLLARALSHRFSKQQLLFAYLQVAYFGWRASGVNRAANRLGIILSRASSAEAAALAAMLKVPMPQSPSSRYRERHAQRVRHILSRWEVEKSA